MKVLISIVVLLSINDIDLGYFINSTQGLKTVVVYAGPAETKLCYQKSINNIQYQFCLDEFNKVQFLNTWDVDFDEIDNLKIGFNYGDIKKEDILAQEYILGWGVLIEHSSGWNIRVDAIGKGLKSDLKFDSKIISFFKVNKNIVCNTPLPELSVPSH